MAYKFFARPTSLAELQNIGDVTVDAILNDKATEGDRNRKALMFAQACREIMLLAVDLESPFGTWVPPEYVSHHTILTDALVKVRQTWLSYLNLSKALGRAK